MPNTNVNFIFESKEAALESIGSAVTFEHVIADVGEAIPDGQQQVVRYYNEDGRIKSLVLITHYKRSDDEHHYGNIEIKDSWEADYEQTVEYIMSLIQEIEYIINHNNETIETITAILNLCCYSNPQPEPEGGYLTFISRSDNNTLYADIEGAYPTLYYTYNGIEWHDWGGEGYSPLSFNNGEYIKFYGDNPNGFSSSPSNFFRFKLDKYTDVTGNTMVLLSREPQLDIPNNYCFYRLFSENEYLLSAPELPAVNLTMNCYEMMFIYCRSLTTPPSTIPAQFIPDNACSYMFAKCYDLQYGPELPAITLGSKSCYAMFSSCTSLQSTPAMFAPANVTDGSCDSMFEDCVSLTSTPDTLPATVMGYGSYHAMFQNCASLRSGPELPAMTLGNDCYSSMFSGCSSLQRTPRLPATVMRDYCYSGMFQGCSALPAYVESELPATRLAVGCYSSMFSGCASLYVAPELPAENLVPHCYSYMFYKCANLEAAPDLNAPVLADMSYDHMFTYCARLNCIKCFATDISAYNCTDDWVEGVSPTGLFIKDNTMEDWEVDSVNGIPIGWGDYQPLTFTILSDGIINWMTNAADNAKTIYYSFDSGETWTGITSTTAGTSFNVSSGDTVMFKGYNYAYGRALEDINSFSGTTAEFEVSGYLTSLTDDPCPCEIPIGQYAYKCLFRDCTGLTSAENLILQKKSLMAYCYAGLFANCTSLTTIPALPATTMVTGCYLDMYSGCTSLTTVSYDYLPATLLGRWCYNSMFANCSSLTTLPHLPATIMVEQCYQNMFYNCVSLTGIPSDYLPSTHLATQCYLAMFESCSSITTAPELPATTLATNCYWCMFRNCTSLIVAPELPAPTLTDGCYLNMFSACSSLNYIKCLATSISYSIALEYWVQGVSPTGTFVKDANMNDWPIGEHGIPQGWTVVDDV